MKLIYFAFTLGVVFAIFSFIWGFIQIGYTLLRLGKTKFEGEDYLIKTIKYFFLVEVTFNFSEKTNAYESNLNQLIITALILLMYFIGKLQSQQKKKVLFQMLANGMPQVENKFNLKAEITVIILSLLIFTGFIFFPEFSKNPLSNWFLVSIEKINETPIFGFIFKFIGFIFLSNMIVKMLNAFSLLISGKPFTQRMSPNAKQNEETKDDSKFDDFEELE